MSLARFEILVCRGPTCAGQRDADRVFRHLCRLIGDRGLEDAVTIGRKNCFGRCSHGPNVYIRAAGRRPRVKSVLYHGVAPADVQEIIEEHIERGRIVDWLTREGADHGDDESGDFSPDVPGKNPSGRGNP